MEKEDTRHQRFSTGEQSKIIGFVRHYCRIDLRIYGEFFGASVLCMQNPILWGIRSFGTDDRGLLHLLLLPRDGKQLTGMHYMVQARHTFGVAAAALEEVRSEILTIPWPTGGTEPELYLWDRRGNLLEHRPLSFFQGIVRSTMDFWELPNRKRMPLWTVSQVDEKRRKKTVMEQYEEQRLYRRLEAQKKFFYFTAGQQDRACEALHTLLPNYSDITVCDKYLDDEALERVFKGWIRCRTLTVFVSKSRMGKEDSEIETPLSDKAREKNERALERRRKMVETLRTFVENGDCRYAALYALGGSSGKGIVHDRYLILDEQVYCLGSSVKDFAKQDTVLFRAPNPAAFVERIAEWKAVPENLLGEWRKTNE
jgi:hypothetical protein